MYNSTVELRNYGAIYYFRMKYINYLTETFTVQFVFVTEITLLQ